MRLIHDGPTPVLELSPREDLPVKITVRREGWLSGEMVETTFLPKPLPRLNPVYEK